MKYIIIYGWLVGSLGACHSTPAAEGTVHPRSLVVSEPVMTGTMEQIETVPATTVYLQKSELSAPIAGYLTQVHIHPGDPVHKGDLLYLIESKEKKALGSWPINGDSTNAAFGIFRVLAPASGFVTRMDKQQPGDFVTEGFPLCWIADPGTVLFQLNIPYEQIGLVHQNPQCRVDLPDGTTVNARIIRPLTQVNPGSQAAPFLARPDAYRFFPEGLIATARLVGYRKKDARLLPVKALLSDELMRHFWVMRLVNDSTAVKVPVIVGQKNDSLVEILQPALSPADRVLTDGNYGLSDTAMVRLRNNINVPKH